MNIKINSLFSLRSIIVLSLLLTLKITLSKAYANSTVKIAIFDTGFCLSKLTSILPDNIKIKDVFNATESNLLYHCKNIDSKNKRQHGYFVLINMLKNLNLKKIKLEVYPYIIFDKNKNQKLLYWKNALFDSKKKKIDYLIIAAGLEISIKKNDLKKSLYPNIDIPTFIAAPQIGRGIKKDSVIWPQSNLDKNKSLLIGSFHSAPNNSTIFNKGLLYQNNIDYFFTNQKNNQAFNGSSLAVALALNKALKICPREFSNGFKILRSCLSRNKKELSFTKKLKLYTY